MGMFIVKAVANSIGVRRPRRLLDEGKKKKDLRSGLEVNEVEWQWDYVEIEIWNSTVKLFWIEFSRIQEIMQLNQREREFSPYCWE